MNKKIKKIGPKCWTPLTVIVWTKTVETLKNVNVIKIVNYDTVVIFGGTIPLKICVSIRFTCSVDMEYFGFDLEAHFQSHI